MIIKTIKLRSLILAAAFSMFALVSSGCSDSDSSEPGTPAVVDPAVLTGPAFTPTSNEGVPIGPIVDSGSGDEDTDTDDDSGTTTATADGPAFGNCHPDVLNQTVYANTGFRVIEATSTDTCPVCDTGDSCTNSQSGACFCLTIIAG